MTTPLQDALARLSSRWHDVYRALLLKRRPPGLEDLAKGMDDAMTEVARAVVVGSAQTDPTVRGRDPKDCERIGELETRVLSLASALKAQQRRGTRAIQRIAIEWCDSNGNPLPTMPVAASEVADILLGLTDAQAPALATVEGAGRVDDGATTGGAA